MLEKAKNPQFWQEVRNNPKYGWIVDRIKKAYEENRQDKILNLSYYERVECHKTGVRTNFDAHYFSRRTWLATTAILALIYPEEEKYIKELHELIWAACDEYSWALTAHTNGTIAVDTTQVDLDNAETGLWLAEISDVLGDRLEPLIGERIKYEVNRRVFENYKKGKFWWEAGENNWAAVCGGSVAGALMYLDPELFEELKPRLLKTLNAFINTFPNDGTCLEGLGYCGYGFGNFIIFADLYNKYTKGEVELLQGEEVKNISTYMQRCFIKGNATVSFSDGNRSGSANAMMQYLLHEKFPDDVRIFVPDMLSVKTSSFSEALRAFLFFDPELEISDFKAEDIYSPDAHQFTANREKYSFVIKGGHNGEPHNHNDIGSFILADESGQVFCDLGAPLYTLQYFQNEHRYEHVCSSSLGHSVPIIDGKEQLPGWKRRGDLSYNDDGSVSVEISGAYDIEDLESFKRDVSFQEDGVILTDSFNIDSGRVVERFVSVVKPEIAEDCIKVGNVRLQFDNSLCKVEQSTREYTKPRPDATIETVYLTDLVLASGENKITFKFVV
ncbi:MAG: heparinase II/III family protein [Clostridia bacterium]|nr:heparinase II/III family protein [Clostridia bacterium]